MSLSKMAAALSLAGLGAGGGMAGGKDLTCGVCREVYRSPRFLPCFHTFCQYCVEGLSRANQDRPFPCPTCRKPTALPPDGALGLQVNQYITAEELQQARDGPRTTPCRRDGHDGYPLVLYCERCEEALCTICKMSKHENHPTSSLADAAARCKRQLGEMQGPLEETIRCLTERSALVNDSLQATQAKGERVKKQIKEQFDLLVAKAFAEVDRFSLKTKGELTADAARVQRELDSLLQLGQRVQRAMGDASDAETVEVEREMRKGRGNKENLQGVKDAVVHTNNVRPSLNFDPASLADDDAIRRLLGSPAEVVVPLGFKGILVPVHQCGQEEGGASRRVHSLRHLGGGLINISYGRTFLGIKRKLEIRLSLNGNLEVLNMPVAIHGAYLYDKRGLYYLVRPFAFSTIHTLKAQGIRRNITVPCENPIALDVTTNMLIVFVYEKTGTTTEERNTERSVQLFNPDSTDDRYRYNPPNRDFHPTDVCFWSDGGEVKLLVADAGNDSVHVVRLGRVAGLPIQGGTSGPGSDLDAEVCFERYLALGDARLVRPTALNVDDEDRVWVGCDNGWILRCDKARENAEPRAGGGQLLGAENGSGSSSHPSGVDSASVAALRVENGSQSGVDSASVAALRVENSSQSGVDSASVAALRVENGSQSGVDSASVAALSVENGSQSGVDSASVAGLAGDNGSQSDVDDAPMVAGLWSDNDSN